MNDSTTFDWSETRFVPYDPAVQKPYPEGWATLSDFTYVSDLYLARARKALVDGRNREAECIVAAITAARAGSMAGDGRSSCPRAC